jgi:hypothetical protein
VGNEAAVDFAVVDVGVGEGAGDSVRSVVAIGKDPHVRILEDLVGKQISKLRENVAGREAVALHLHFELLEVVVRPILMAMPCSSTGPQPGYCAATSLSVGSLSLYIHMTSMATARIVVPAREYVVISRRVLAQWAIMGDFWRLKSVGKILGGYLVETSTYRIALCTLNMPLEPGWSTIART